MFPPEAPKHTQAVYGGTGSPNPKQILQEAGWSDFKILYLTGRHAHHSRSSEVNGLLLKQHTGAACLNHASILTHRGSDANLPSFF